MTMTNEELLFLEQVDDKIECQPTETECEAAADWLTIARCCGADVPLCTPHLDVSRQWIAEHKDYVITCNACDTDLGMDNTFDGLFRLEKL